MSLLTNSPFAHAVLRLFRLAGSAVSLRSTICLQRPFLGSLRTFVIALQVRRATLGVLGPYWSWAEPVVRRNVSSCCGSAENSGWCSFSWATLGQGYSSLQLAWVAGMWPIRGLLFDFVSKATIRPSPSPKSSIMNWTASTHCREHTAPSAFAWLPGPHSSLLMNFLLEVLLFLPTIWPQVGPPGSDMF